jgi:hypothetical protein
MRGKLYLAVGVVVSLVVAIAGIASAEGVVYVPVAHLEPHLNVSFTPKAVSKTRPTPGELSFSWEVTADDGSPPPALREFVLKTDRDMTFDLKGFPACRPAFGVEPAWPIPIRCRPALIGHGRIDLSIAFPEAEAIYQSSELLIYRGADKKGVPTILAYAYVTVPTPAVILIQGTIRKVADPRVGLEVAFTVPKIAGGSGSVTSFIATIHKEYLYKGKHHSAVRLKCPDGKFLAETQLNFADGTQLSGESIRTCTGTN